MAAMHTHYSSRTGETVCVGCGVVLHEQPPLNIDTNGSLERVNPSVVWALIKRGLLTKAFTSEGGLAGRIV